LRHGDDSQRTALIEYLIQNIAKIAKQQDPSTLVLTSAISEVFLRKLTKQGFIKYTEGSEFVDTREDLIEMGDPNGGGLKEMDEKLKTYATVTGLGKHHLTYQ
jgi:hypothetical protein